MKNKIRFEDFILFESQDYLLVNKPPFLSTLEDRADKDNLLAMAREFLPSMQACHRLDKDTSGVLAMAKNAEAYRALSIQFEKRTVTKIYHAIVDGIHNFQQQLVDAAILKQDDGKAKISKTKGKPAQTWFTSLESYKGYTLIECRPITGRMHQIRLHLSLLGAPITGDEAYGGKQFYLSAIKRGFNLKKDTDEQPLLKRMALHAYSLEFNDLQENKVKVIAPYPKDIHALIKQLELNR